VRVTRLPTGSIASDWSGHEVRHAALSDRYVSVSQRRHTMNIILRSEGNNDDMFCAALDLFRVNGRRYVYGGVFK
jgi:hypothetical protein